MGATWRVTVGLIKNIRLYQAHQNRSGLWQKAICRLARFKHLIFSILTSSDIDIRARFGEELRLPHPTGIVIHENVKIGTNCMIMQQVTIGQLSGEGVPIIGSNVYIGAGAKVLGPIRIGDGARIGANAVVLIDLPSESTAVGVPAKIIRAH